MPKIWTQFTNSISLDDNRYSIRTSTYLYEYACVAVLKCKYMYVLLGRVLSI